MEMGNTSKALGQMLSSSTLAKRSIHLKMIPDSVNCKFLSSIVYPHTRDDMVMHKHSNKWANANVVK